ncbi:hypothetical protein NP233_g11606 [Leucocoprinus birnbaumii]|uniref:Nephrocystin 3-like N-terminal domain-containing protein n=1 Tax=Leucocoprinus birnbaumii TaxID=56174 RepID=A0AAD5YNT2_9AGAR|nr:hypothetical protein NP233_g11606 [Leucocoprinus birnbaumii]
MLLSFVHNSLPWGNPLLSYSQQLSAMMSQTNAESSLDTIRPELFQGARDFMINNPTFVSYSSNEDRFIDILAKSALPGAAFDSSERDPPPSCHPGTRLDISDEIHTWEIRHRPDISELESALENSILGATLFFSRANRRNDPKRVFTTIIYQLVVKHSRYREYVLSVLARDPHAVHKSVAEQFKRLIVQPVIDGVFSNDADRHSILIAIDGLDECDGERAQCEILSLIAKLAIEYPTSPFIWLIASRPEPHIRGSFDKITNAYYTQLVIPVDSNQGCKDVERYLRDKFDEIRSYYPNQFSHTLRAWPAEIHFTKVATRAKGMFVFASTLINFIVALDSVILTNTNPFAELDALYDVILASVPEENSTTLRHLLAPLILRSGYVRAWRPNPDDIHFVCNFWGITQAHAFSTLHKLHSVIIVPETRDRRLLVYHASFPEYLATASRSGRFYIDVVNLTEQLFQRAERILTECCIDTTLQTAFADQIHLSWPFGPERTWQKSRLQYRLAAASFRRIVHPNYMGLKHDLVQRLSRFFHVLDWGKDAESLRRITRNGPRDPEDVQYSPHLIILQQGAVWTSEKMSKNRAEFRLARSAQWKARLEDHLAYIWRENPPHQIYILGKGAKACAVIWLVKDNKAWYYMLPYIEPWGEP